jgi:hypothetical protein
VVPAKIEIIGANRCPVKENDGSTTGTLPAFGQWFRAVRTPPGRQPSDSIRR